jgi:large subunit ribosomal protein L24
MTYKGEDFASIKAEFEGFIAEKEKKEELLWFDK